MPEYRVLKYYRYTEELEVEAKDMIEAKSKALGMDGERNYDDYLYDCEATEI